MDESNTCSLTCALTNGHFRTTPLFIFTSNASSRCLSLPCTVPFITRFMWRQRLMFCNARNVVWLYEDWSRSPTSARRLMTYILPLHGWGAVVTLKAPSIRHIYNEWSSNGPKKEEDLRACNFEDPILIWRRWTWLWRWGEKGISLKGGKGRCNPIGPRPSKKARMASSGYELITKCVISHTWCMGWLKFSKY